MLCSALTTLQVYSKYLPNSFYYSYIQMFLNNGFKLKLLGKNKELSRKPQVESIIQNHKHITIIITAI